MFKHELTERLASCFRDFDPNMHINIFTLEEDLFEFDAVSELWQGIGFFKRIKKSVELVMADKGISEKYVFVVCPVTPSEFGRRLDYEEN